MVTDNCITILAKIIIKSESNNLMFKLGIVTFWLFAVMPKSTAWARTVKNC